MSASKYALMPRCWSDMSDWAEWNRLNVLARDTSDKPLDHYCTDCTPEYQQRMKGEGRCVNPTITFVQIVERQYDPRRHARKEVKTDAVKGVLNAKA